MSYWHQMYPRRQRTERLEVENGEARFESLMAKDLSERDRNFAESLKRQFEDGGKLSTKQIECVERMEQRYSPESVLKRERWAQSYKGAHREVAMICARYYRTTTYFRDLATKILLDEDFIPTEKQFNALTKTSMPRRPSLLRLSRLPTLSVRSPRFVPTTTWFSVTTFTTRLGS